MLYQTFLKILQVMPRHLKNILLLLLASGVTQAGTAYLLQAQVKGYLIHLLNRHNPKAAGGAVFMERILNRKP